MKRMLKGGWLIYSDRREQKDLLVDGEKIVKVAADLDPKEADEVVDVTGKLLFPGFIDPHTHFDLEVSNTVTADDYFTGTRAAVAEGTTAIIDFATQNRGETLAEALVNWDRKSMGKSCCDYGYHMAISEWNDSISEEIAEMPKKGVTSFKLYMTYDAMYLNDGDIYRALKRMKEIGGLAGVHCENRELIDALVKEKKEQKHLTTEYHGKSRPWQTEAEAIDRLLNIASVVDVPVMVVHLSTAAGYEVIMNARKRKQKVFTETCPQYLLMTEDKYKLPDFEGAKYVIAPPLRTGHDQEVLWQALTDHHIHTIATDHCSFNWQQKLAGREDFTKIPCGMPGVETRPSLIYTYGVRTGRLTEEQMCGYLSETPARLYGLYPEKGTLTPGSDADIVVWDPETERTLSKDTQVAAVDYHPYEGIKVWGIAEQVYLRGHLTAVKGKVMKEKMGKYLHRRKMEC